MNTKKIAAALAGLAFVGVSHAGLVAQWNFDDQTLADSVGDGTHDGYVLGSSGYGFTNDTATGTGYALDFSALSNILVIANSASGDAGYQDTFDAPAAFTYSMWAKSTDGVWNQWSEFGGKGYEVPYGQTGTDTGWALRSRGYGTHSKDGTQVSFYGSNAARDSDISVDMTDQEWHMLTFTYDSADGALKLYIDGVEEGSATASLTDASAYSLVFGARSETERWENMFLDDIRFYDHAMTATEVGVLAGGYLNADPAEVDLFLVSPHTTVTGSVVVSYAAESTVDIDVSIDEQTYAGAFSVLGTNPRTLTSPTNNTLEILFDNSIANLSAGETATGLVAIAWYPTGGGTTNVVNVPFSVVNGFLPGATNLYIGSTGGSWGEASNWDLARVPGVAAADLAIVEGEVVVNHSSSFPTYFDWETVVRGGAVLNIGADMLNAGDITVGESSAGTGTVSQTAGIVSAPLLTIGEDSLYILTGGSVTTMNASVDGVLNVSGGSLVVNEDDTSGTDMSGAGLVKIQSGAFTLSSFGSVTTSYCDYEISGGAVDFQKVARFRGEIKVVGDGASISAYTLDTSSANSVDMVFEMGTNGISGFNVTSWVDLEYATLTIDGSAYTGSAGVFTLFDTPNLTATSTAVTVTGFDPELSVYVTQDQDTDEVKLTISSGGFDDWIFAYVPGGGAAAARDADPDDDGQSNFMEYALGGDPTNSAVTGRVEFSTDGSIFEYVYGRKIGSEDDLDYTLYFGTSLSPADWGTADVVEVAAGAYIDGYESVTNQVDISSQSVGFMKLEVEEL